MKTLYRSGNLVVILAVWLMYSLPSHSAVLRKGFDIHRPPVEATQEAKINDFRLNPPKVVEMSVEKKNGKKMLLAVRFAPDRRIKSTVTLTFEEASVVLHDDGKAGDRKAGDRVFSAVVNSEWEALAAEQDRILEKARSRNQLAVPTFKNRAIVGEQKINLSELSRLRKKGIIKFLPFGTGATTVVPGESLFITDPAVVGDPTRTIDPCSGAGTAMGKWTFEYLMTAMVGNTGINPSDFVENWLKNWESLQTVNSFPIVARNDPQHGMQKFLANWPRLANGKLDLSKAPMKLSAIVNRIDLASNSAYGAGGGAEGRFVFTVVSGTGSNCSPQPFTVIFEYGVPIHSCSGIKSWAQQWLNLQNSPLGSPSYNKALEDITEKFAAANVDPSKPNGSALNQLRTNEIFLDSPWELREFQVGANHELNEVTVKQTPQKMLGSSLLYFQGGTANADLVSWANANAGPIANNTFTVPDTLPSGPHFLGASSPANSQDFWNATKTATTQIVSEPVRHQLSLNSCNSCHTEETGTPFRHVQQGPTGPASLSQFLTGFTKTVNVSPSTQTIPANSSNPSYNYNDLLRRAQVLSEDASSSCFGLVRDDVLLATD